MRSDFCPSFVLIRPYRQARLPLYHFDLYRLKEPRDILALGYEEYLYADGVAVIEWADRMGYLGPCEFLKVELFIKEGSKRRLRVSAQGARPRELLRKIHENTGH